MENEIELNQVIRSATMARHTYLMSKTIVNREMFRRWYMVLGTIATDDSKMMELRQKALGAMYRLQLSGI